MQSLKYVFFIKFYGLSSASELIWEKMLLASDMEKSSIEGTKAPMSFVNDLWGRMKEKLPLQQWEMKNQRKLCF